MKKNLSKIQDSDIEIFKGASVTFVVKIVGTIFSFILQVVLARLLSIENYGNYTYIMAWVSIISGFSSVGFNTSLIRFIPQYIHREEFGKYKGVILTSFFVTGVTTLSLSFIAIITILFFDSNVFANNIYSIAGIFILTSFIILLSAIEKAKKNMFMAHAPYQIFKHVLILIGVILLNTAWETVSIGELLKVTVLSVLLILTWQIVSLKSRLFPDTVIKKTIYNVKEWIKVSIPLFAISGFLILLNQTDIVMLGIFSESSEVGIYNVAYKISTLTSFILVAVNGIVGSKISELYYQNKLLELKRMARLVANIVFWPTLIVSLVIIIFSSEILGFFGNEFISGRKLLYILLFGQAVNAIVGSVGYYLNMTGNENISMKIFGTTALINIILNPVAIIYYGAVGAAVITALTTTIWNVWMYIVVRKKLNINSSIF